jgi:hypothetical protein
VTSPTKIAAPRCGSPVVCATSDGLDAGTAVFGARGAIWSATALHPASRINQKSNTSAACRIDRLLLFVAFHSEDRRKPRMAAIQSVYLL